MRTLSIGAVLFAAALAVGACATKTGTGAAAGAVGGAVVGGLSETNAPRFRTYVIMENHPSFTYMGEVIVGTELPATVTYYEVPREYGVTTYRYTIVNGRTVLVDPMTHRIVQIIG